MPLSSGDVTVPPQPVDDIRELQGVEPLPEHEFPWEGVAIGLGVALLLALLIHYLRRRRRSREPESIEAATRRRLAALAALESPDLRAFHVEIANIVTGYVETALGLRASRLTAREILRAFRRNGHMSEEWQGQLARLLAECERAKFARVRDQEWDPRAVVAECRRILEALAVAVAAAPRLASPWVWEREQASRDREGAVAVAQFSTRLLTRAARKQAPAARMACARRRGACLDAGASNRRGCCWHCSRCRCWRCGAADRASPRCACRDTSTCRLRGARSG